MAGVGRPKIQISDLPEGWKENMLLAAKQGKSQLSIRINCLDGICHETWERLIKEEPEFTETVKKCNDYIQDWWEEVGREGAIGANAINPTTWIFNMKNRFDWRDKRDIEQSGGISLTMPDKDAGTL